jgi:hypothetical protein
MNAMQTTLHYNETILRRAVFCFWRRSVGWPIFIVPPLLAYLVFALQRGQRGWPVGVVATVLLVVIAMPVMVYVVHFRNTMQKFRDLGEPLATLSFDDQSFTLSSAQGSSTLRWAAVTEVWTFDTVWLLLFSKAHFVTLPLADLPLEMQQLIKKNVLASGGKVRVNS